MPPWLPKAINYTVLAILAAAGGLFLLFRLSDLLTWIGIALVISLALEPLVNRLEERGWKRSRATMTVMLGLFGMFIVIVLAIFPLLFRQAKAFVENIPHLVDQLNPYLQKWFNTSVNQESLQQQLKSLDINLGNLIGQVAKNALVFGASLISGLFNFFTVAFFSYYITVEGRHLRRGVSLLFRSKQQQETIFNVWELSIQKTGAYLYSRGILAAINGTVTLIVLLLLDVPYALPLALFVGLTAEFIPSVGTYISAILPLLVILLESPAKAVVFLIYIIIYQQIENYFLSPKISAKTMNLHPAIAFGAAIAGLSIAGALGAFIALPLAAVGQAFLTSYIDHNKARATTPSSAKS